MNNEIDDASLREFLLGKVSDEDRGRVEDLFLTDSHAKERVLGVEQDLIEDYLEGMLSEEDSERFVSRYAQTEEQRRRLRITKSIKDWAIAESASTVPAKGSGFRAWFGFRPVFVIPIAATALIVIVVAAVWLNRRSEHQAIEQELAQLNAASNLREGRVSIELSPVTVRGVEPQAQLKTPDNGVIQLRLLWLQRERYPAYQATIRRVGDSESFLVRNIQPDSDGKAIRVILPARILTKGTYQINLSGIAADGTESAPEEYTFTPEFLAP